MRPLPWSHSTLAGFDTCPRQYEEIKVHKNYQDAKNPASIWGDEVHHAFEVYLKASGALPLPINMQCYTEYLDNFLARRGTLLAEQKYGLDVKLRPCDFLAPEVWMRGIVDVLTLDGDTAYVDDHKTGKNRKVNMQQLIVFSLLVFYHHPPIDTCHVAYHWLQLGAKDTKTFHRAEIPAMWESLMPRLTAYKKAFDMGIFPPKPSGLCRRNCAVDSCEYFGGGRR